MFLGGAITMIVISSELRKRMRVAYALRRVPLSAMTHIVPCPSNPSAGTLAIGTLSKIGRNARLELADGRLATLHEGDTLALVFGNRYATEQFEGYAGTDADNCDLLSSGGLCGVVTSKHAAVGDPSKLHLLGAIASVQGLPLQLRKFAVTTPRMELHRRPRIIVVCGTSMDSGKTYTAMSLIIGLRQQGLRVAGIKLTGTAAGRDTWAMHDAGACIALDFIDGGYPSTYLCEPSEILEMSEQLITHATEHQADWAVIEIADGLLQRETAALLQSASFMSQVTACVFTTGDPLGAVGGVSVLRRWGITPVVISGLITRSPLAMREAQSATGIRCMTAEALQSGDLNGVLSEAPYIPNRIGIDGFREYGSA
jgi:hypothetical protein